MTDKGHKNILLGMQYAGAGLGIVAGILNIRRIVKESREGAKMLEADKRHLAALIAAEMEERSKRGN